MRKRILSILLVFVMLLGMLPATALAEDIPFEAYTDEADITDITVSQLQWIDWGGTAVDVPCYTLAIPEGTEEVILSFEDEKECAYYDCYGEFIGYIDGYEEAGGMLADYEFYVPMQDSDDDGKLDGVSVQIPYSYTTELYIQFVYADPFTVIVNDEKVTDVTKETVDWSGVWGGTSDFPCYKVTVPAGAAEATLIFDEEFELMSYTSSGDNITENGSFGLLGCGYKVTVGIQDANDDGELDGVSVQIPQSYSPLYLILFRYPLAEGECDHAYDEEETTPATCTDAGEMTYTCSKCGESYTDEIPATDHAWDAGTVTTPATCAAAGEKRFVCQNDGSHTKTEPVDKLPHTYGEGEVTTPATCKADGERTYTCSVCPEGTAGHIKTEKINKLNDHVFGEDGKAEYCSGKCGTPNPNYADPNMPELVDGVYQIGTPAELVAFAKYVNKGIDASYLSAVLTSDIDLSDVTWPGIGNGKAFFGSFDGQKHTVTLNGSIFGFFANTMGTWDGNCNLKVPVIVTNVITDGTVQNTPLVHQAGYTQVTDCINRATVTGGNASVAGIVGNANYASNAGNRYCDLLIQNCANEGDIIGSSYVGGILGYSIAGTRIEGCSNTGAISGTSNVGGLAGYLQEGNGTCYIHNSYNQGDVAGSSAVGGIIGNLYNGVAVTNCYNAGEATYGIAGNVYNNTASITDCFYLVSKSAMGAPARTSGGDGDTSTDVIAPVSVSLDDMISADFVAQMGSSFRQSCPGPVFSWQTPAEHDTTDGICANCGLGGTETFSVTMVNAAGYTISGNATVVQGTVYGFTVTIASGYEASESFVVKVNNVPVTDMGGVYAVSNVQGPLRITVEGVITIPDTYRVTLPSEGNGYRVTPCDGYLTNSADREGDYRFTVSCVDGFTEGEDFAVKVNGVTQTADSDGVYTVSNIKKALTVTVEGVVTIPEAREITATVTLTVTKDQYYFYRSPKTNTIFANLTLTVPYFDLSLYGLERYYFNPNCYWIDESTGGRRQTPGNRETAYGAVTYMHAFIYATEVFYLGYTPDVAGTGQSYRDGVFTQNIKWDNQPAGSSFVNLWDHGTNLNYYLQYSYPLGLPEWGSTADQIEIRDGDILSVHMLNEGNGSDFRFFVMDDTNGKFDAATDHMDSATVEYGDTVDLTLFTSKNSAQYTTGHQIMANTQIYWLKDDFKQDIREWNYLTFGRIPEEDTWEDDYADEEKLFTDAGGKIVIDTTDLTPGTYYLATYGGFTKGTGEADSTGFVSAGSEAGPALFCLTVVCNHNAVATPAADATCTENGNTAYWTCSKCGKFFSDAEAVIEIEENSWVIPAGHTLTKVEALEPTYSAAGNTEHWVCGVCGKYFADAEAAEETTKEAVTVPKKEAPPAVTLPDKPASSGQSSETITNADGSTTKTETKKDGSVVVINTATDGSTATVVTTADGEVTATVSVSAAAIAAAEAEDKAVRLPAIEEADVVTVATGAENPVAVEIPLDNVTAGTVAVLVNPDGTETVIAGSIPTENGLMLEIADGACIRIVDNAAAFGDVSSSDWEKNAVDFVSARGIMTGTANNTFSPDSTTTRAQIWTMLARLSGVDTSVGETWYSEGQKWAVENGISDGTNAGGEITREQLATMLWRCMGGTTSDAAVDQFTDSAEISSWAQEAMQWAVAYGILSGYNSALNPAGDASRAQVAQMLMNLLTAAL